MATKMFKMTTKICQTSSKIKDSTDMEKKRSICENYINDAKKGGKNKQKNPTK